MRTARTDGLIGVDGGGTSCRVALVLRGARFDVRVGSANVTTDMAAALATVGNGLQQVATAAGLALSDIRDFPAYLGLAGVSGPEIARQVARALPLENAVVADDQGISVAGALAEADGAIVGIGTGSFLGRQHSGSIQLMGGYGLILGDEASGGWLGRAVLSRTLRSIDGLEAPSALCDRIFAGFSHETAAIVAFARKATPAEFGRFAPQVAAAASTGDPAGRDLMQAGADYIARGLHVLGWARNEPVCLMGSLAGHYRPYLPDSVQQAITWPKGTALDGALSLAARHASSHPRTAP